MRLKIVEIRQHGEGGTRRVITQVVNADSGEAVDFVSGVVIRIVPCDFTRAEITIVDPEVEIRDWQEGDPELPQGV